MANSGETEATVRPERDDRTTMIWAVAFLAAVALFASGFALGQLAADDDDHHHGRFEIDIDPRDFPRGELPRGPFERFPGERERPPRFDEVPEAEVPEDSGFLGINGVNPPNRDGVVVLEVLPGTAAAEAGLQPFDLIVSYGDHPVGGMDALVELVADTEPGTEVVLEVIRFGERLRLEVVIGSRVD